MSSTPPNPTPQADSTVLPDDVDAVAGGSKSAAPDIVNLPLGKELSESSALALAMSRPVRWIVIAGPSKAGKTTLLVSLFEMFQEGPVGGSLFAGSNTLPALELRCHLSRLASQNETADTERTEFTGAPTYLHMRICSQDTPQPPIDFLFTDVSGEMFKNARDSTTECKELTFLRRAGYFLLLLDGRKAVRVEKWAMVQDCKALLQSCVYSEMLAEDCVVNVVWSKFDYFVAAKNEKDDQTFRQEVERDFRASFGDRIVHLKFSVLAARPKRARSLGYGHGVPELLNEWVTFWPRIRHMDVYPHLLSGVRESELFGVRHFAAVRKT
jgi:hypothetical protein